MSASLGIASLASFGVALGGTWLVARSAPWLGLLDIPNQRSSHERVTPRGGGIGILVGVGSGLFLLYVLGGMPSRQLGILLAGSGVISVLGVIDDRHPLRARYRLAVQVLVAALVVAVLGGTDRLPLPPPLNPPLGLLAGPCTVLWIVAVTNFFNFMDGIDGLAGGQAVASCVGVVMAAWAVGAEQGAILVGAATIGFLSWNRPPARIFLGDAGSTALGFVIATLPLLANRGNRPAAILAVAIGLSLFLFDPVETLARLARRGHPIGQAHRAHSYQILASSHERSGLVAGALVAAGTVLAIVGGLTYRTSRLVWPAALLGLCAYVIERHLARAGRYQKPFGTTRLS